MKNKKERKKEKIQVCNLCDSLKTENSRKGKKIIKDLRKATK